ncbi:MAG TPA: cytochrome c [Pyrinomonadaceae bacterium]|nr:cytochrome c [Pyrinomonadaceae bacterium]
MKCNFRLLLKWAAVLAASLFFISCFGSGQERYSLQKDNSYAASLFRQNCAICHGPEADGKTLDDGTNVPSLRKGEFKYKTKAEIYKQISDGGHGMTPFRGQLSERELNLLVDLVHDKLRSRQQDGNQPQ